jgi:NTP pyrophosphatase (non-canonical NTP hydrolase)
VPNRFASPRAPPVQAKIVVVLDRLLLVVIAQERRFPGGVDPFKMVCRLAEECGELAAEVQHWEGEGIKRDKHGDPDPERTAKEVMDVLTAALSIARHYELMERLVERTEVSIARSIDEGLLTDEEVRG